MKVILCVLAAFLASASAISLEEWEEDSYVVIRTGKRAEAYDDAQSSVKCGKHYVMKQCDCEDPDTCDGAWIRSNLEEDECIVWTRAAINVGEKIIGAVPKATCARVMVHVESEVGANPTVACPEKFARIGCNFHNEYQQHAADNLGVTQRNGRCETYGKCEACRVQAICLRNKDA